MLSSANLPPTKPPSPFWPSSMFRRNAYVGFLQPCESSSQTLPNLLHLCDLLETSCATFPHIFIEHVQRCGFCTSSFLRTSILQPSFEPLAQQRFVWLPATLLHIAQTWYCWLAATLRLFLPIHLHRSDLLQTTFQHAFLQKPFLLSSCNLAALPLKFHHLSFISPSFSPSPIHLHRNDLGSCVAVIRSHSYLLECIVTVCAVHGLILSRLCRVQSNVAFLHPPKLQFSFRLVFASQ